MSITLTVDGQTVIVPEGASVLDAVNRLGVPLPQLCKDPDRSPLGACRTCLVQVEGVRGFPPRADAGDGGDGRHDASRRTPSGSGAGCWI